MEQETLNVFAHRLISNHEVKAFIGILLSNGLSLEELISTINFYRYETVQNDPSKVESNLNEIHFG
jgi:hypothetical protein